MRTFSVLATWVAAIATIGGTGASAQVRETRPVLAILDFTNSALVDHETYQPFTVGIASMLISELRQNESIELVERERLNHVLDEIRLGQSGAVDQETAVRAGQVLGAHHIIFGVFFVDPAGNLRLDARAVSVETSRIEHVETVTDDADNLLRAVSQLGKQLATSLDLPGVVPRPALPGARDGQMLVNLMYSRAQLEEDLDNNDSAVRLYREFLARSPPGYAVRLRQEAEDRIRTLTGGQHE